MADIQDQKQTIERAIERARDGVGDSIDELDRHLRTNLDPRTLARTYAGPMIAGGAVLGVLVGFGLPKVLRRLVTWGVPIAILAAAVKSKKQKAESRNELSREASGSSTF
jgi:hypothetical protein